MSPDGIEDLARNVDEKARDGGYQISDIQGLRSELQDWRKKAANPTIYGEPSCIFDDRSFFENYTYHWGGRNELQFNLKIRKYNGVPKVRYGVGFRLQPSQNRSIENPIQRRVKLFNQYLGAHREELGGLGLGMWYSRKVEGEKVPSRIFRPHKISGRLLGRQITVVLGRREEPSQLTYDDILILYDEFLPLYKYIESNLELEDSFDADSFSPLSDQLDPLTITESPRAEVEEELTDNELNPASIEELAYTVDKRAEAGGFEIADLQDIRREVKDEDLEDRPDQKPTSDIFRTGDLGDDFVFHSGGRNELQFNLGLRRYDGQWMVRYGGALHYKLGEYMEILRPLRARIGLFNEYLRANPGELDGLTMWYEPEGSGVPKGNHSPKEISEDLVEEGTFIFVGKRVKPSELGYDDILEVFDRLLPLYKYIERNLNPEVFADPENSSQPSTDISPERKYETTVKRPETEVSVDLQHNRMQDVLEERLASEYGAENVHVESPTEQGRSVDLVVEKEGGEWFYEIKPFSEPRICFRKAIGQLLEYAYWSGSKGPERLVVVGKSELGQEGREYLKRLKEKFSLPMEYQQLRIE